MSVDRWNIFYDLALWLRAAERIEVPAGGVVTGPLEIDPLPEPSAGPYPDLAEDWRSWWHGLVGLPRWHPERSAGPPPQLAYGPPDFSGIAGRTELHRVATARWEEANKWHSRRKLAGVRRFQQQRPQPNESLLVREVERSLGRQVPPFDLEFVLLPVRDEEIREVTPTRYLVPEAVYDGPGWVAWLRPLVVRLAS
jgi:hypothetical protein